MAPEESKLSLHLGLKTAEIIQISKKIQRKMHTPASGINWLGLTI